MRQRPAGVIWPCKHYRPGTALFSGSVIGCCGLMRNWCGAILRKLSLMWWPRFARVRSNRVENNLTSIVR
jgi:hypothetical protein